MTERRPDRLARAAGALAASDRALLQLWTHRRLDDATLARATGLRAESIAAHRGRLLERLIDAISLSPDERAVLSMWAGRGLDDAEIAALTGATPAAVGASRARAVARLGRALAVPAAEVREGLAALARANARRPPAESPVPARAARSPTEPRRADSVTPRRTRRPGRQSAPPFRAPAPPVAPRAGRRASGHRLSERVRILLACALVAALSTVVAQAVAPRRYHATAQLVVNPVQAGDPNFSGIPVITTTGGDPSSAPQTAQTLVASPAVVALASARLGAGWPAARVVSSVQVTAASNADIVSVTATADTPESALHLTDTYVAAALALRRAQLQSAIDDQLAISQAQLSALSRDPSLPGSTAENRYSAIASLVGRGDPTLTLARAAVLSGQPGRWHTLEILIIALLCGGVMGVVGGWFAGPLSRRRISDERRVVGLTRLPVLARVGWEGDGAVTSGGLERMLSLVTESRQPLRTISVIGCDAGAESAGVAMAAAEALTRRDETIALLEMDWRRWDEQSSPDPEGVTPRRRVRTDLRGGLQPSSRDARLLLGMVYSEAGPTTTADAVRHAMAQADRVILATSPDWQSALSALAVADLALVVVVIGRTTETDVAQVQRALAAAGGCRAGVVAVAPGPWHADRGRRGRGRGRSRRRPAYPATPGLERAA